MTPERKTELAQAWKDCGDGWRVLGMPLLDGYRLYGLPDELGWVEALAQDGFTEDLHESEILPDPTAPGNLGIIQAQVRELDGDPGILSDACRESGNPLGEYKWAIFFRKRTHLRKNWYDTEFEAWLAALQWLTKGAGDAND
jgi:hypothetical protein